MTEATTDVVRQLSTDQLKAITSFEDVAALAREMGTDVVSSGELGDGFTLLEDKDKTRLVGVPLMLITWSFTEGDYGEFVTCRVLAQMSAKGVPEKLVINDGSTGIRDQLKTMTPGSPIFARRGLRKSDYTVKLADPKTGEMKDTAATTFYIDTAQ